MTAEPAGREPDLQITVHVGSVGTTEAIARAVREAVRRYQARGGPELV